MKESGLARATLRSDIPAAVVVFLVALPLCLGISLASGAPLISGIISGIVGGIVVGSLSGSHVGVSGPAAGLAVIVLVAIQDLGSFDVFLVAAVLAGLIQMALGFAKAGVIGYYFPSSVISGMLAGIGVVIVVKQIPHALGYDKDPEGDFSFQQIDGENAVSELTMALSHISPGPLVITCVSLAILLLWERPKFRANKALSLVPGPLVAVVVGVLLALVFRSKAGFSLSADQLVAIPLVDSVASMASLFTFPDFSALGTVEVYSTAFVLAIVASLETLLCVEATDKLDPLKRVTPTNRELKAQGVGNVIAGLVGGLPVTQVIVRSSANIQAGGKSKASAVIHGVLLLVSALAMPAVVNLIPLATLAAVLLVVGFKLAKPSLFRKMLEKGMPQFVPFLATVLGVVFIDLLAGIALGLAAAIFSLLIENFRLPYEMETLSKASGKRIRIALAQQVTFLNKASILQTLSELPRGSIVEIDAMRSAFVHGDVVEIIDDFVVGAVDRGIDVTVLGLEHLQKGQPSAGTDVSVAPLRDGQETSDNR